MQTVKVLQASSLGRLILLMPVFAVWLLIQPFMPAQASLPEKTLILMLFLLGTCQFVIGWIIARSCHCYSLSPLHIFTFASYGFFCFMPALSVLADYHYVLQPQDIHGMTLLMSTAILSILVFTFFYVLIIGNSQLIQIPKVSLNKKNKCLYWLTFFVGAIAIIVLYTLVIKSGFGSHARLAIVLREKGWLLRLAELIAISGLLMVISGKTNNSKKWFVLGILLISLFAFLRVPFQNRENVLKYFFIVLILLQITSNRRFRTSEVAIVLICLMSIVILFPFLSNIRGNKDISSALYAYKYFVFRDFNFSEIPSALMAQDEFKGIIGVTEGAWRIFSMLIPRGLYPDKAYSLGTLATSLVTPLPGYDPLDPAYSYAPTYYGTFYLISGFMGIIVFTIFLAVVVGLSIKSSRYAYFESRNLHKPVISSLVVYYFTFSVLKVDIENILLSIIIPLIILQLLSLLEKIRVRPRAVN